MTNQFVAARPNVFLTSMFRSGSTHVKQTLLRLLTLEYRASTTVTSAGPRGDDGYPAINLCAAQLLFSQPAQIFHQHTCGTSGNVVLLNAAKLYPIVMMRNILDSMVSVRELISGQLTQALGIYFPPTFQSMTEEQQLWWVVKNLPNFYFTFYSSWMEADIPKHVIWYDDYYADQVTGVRGILEFTGLSELGTVSDEAIKAATHVGPDSRFKYGISGRGVEILTGNMIQDVISQALAWPNGDELVERLIQP